jgi:hydrogenase expression/formation protein HypE
MEFSCPAPFPAGSAITLAHGGGGRLSAELMRDLFLPAFRNAALERLDDQAQMAAGNVRLAFSTDSFVVRPLFFRGGDIGSLAVHGTLNDLAMGGARPLCLSAAFILEEGLDRETLERVVRSMGEAAARAGVPIVTGDTKVVERGKGDGVFINTAGIGIVGAGLELSASHARPGDVVLLSGTLGDHGVAIMAEREGLEFESPVASDSANLWPLVETMLATGARIRAMRDPTRGGLSSTLNEFAAASRAGFRIEEAAIPVREEVRGACETLGLDPLYVANEGKLVAVVDAADADGLLEAMRGHPLGAAASRIGVVTGENPGMVTMRTVFGTTRVVDMISGEQLPRIC